MKPLVTKRTTQAFTPDKPSLNRSRPWLEVMGNKAGLLTRCAKLLMSEAMAGKEYIDSAIFTVIFVAIAFKWLCFAHSCVEYLTRIGTTRYIRRTGFLAGQ